MVASPYIKLRILYIKLFLEARTANYWTTRKSARTWIFIEKTKREFQVC